MKNLFKNQIILFVTLFTIPLQTKNSISNISNKVTTSVSSFFKRSKEEVTHQEFNNISRLEICMEHGPITLESWKQNCVLVELKKKGSAEFLQNIQLKHQIDHQVLQISTALHDAKISGNTSIRILVPKNLPIKITTTDGNITIKKISGPLELTSTRGAMSITQGSGTVIANTIHGNITIQRKKMKSDHALNIYSQHGNITLAVPQDINADLQAHTTTGKIISDLFITLHPQTVQLYEKTFQEMHHHVHGLIGQPIQHTEPTIILLSTDSGVIKICAHDALFKKK
jgi:hypothetical protein